MNITSWPPRYRPDAWAVASDPSARSCQPAGDLPLGGQVVVYVLLAMLIIIFAAGIFSVVYPPLSDAENIEPFFNLDSFEPESPGSCVDEKRAP